MIKYLLSLFLIIIISFVLIGCSYELNDHFNEEDALAIVLKEVSQLDNLDGEANILEFKSNMNIQADITTEVIKSENNRFTVKLTKKWNVEMNGVRPVSYWIYEVEPEYIALVEHVDMDYMINIINN